MLSKILVLLFAISPVWADVEVEMLNPPKDNWGKQVDNVWRLRMKDAIKTYRAQTEPALGELKQDVRFYLAVNADEAKQSAPEGKSKAFVLNFDGKQSSRVIKVAPYQRLASNLAAQQMEELAGSGYSNTHEWLRVGSTAWLSAEVAAKHSEATVDNAFQEVTSWLRNTKDVTGNTKDVTDMAAFFSARDGQSKNTGFKNTAMLMTYRLKELLGEKYLKALAGYLRQAGKPGFDADQAFEQHFGRSTAAFLQDYKQWTQQIKDEKRVHKKPIPSASGYATLEQAERFPLEDEAARKGLNRYIKERAPKALALSLRGAWSYRADDVNAVENALVSCRRSDPVSCRLYAIDNTVVYQPPVPGEAFIEVRMASHGTDGWTTDIREKYLLVTQRSTEELRKLVREKMEVGFDETVRIHLVTGIDDFSRVMQDEMGYSEQYANDASVLFGGFSGERGQIVIPFKMGLDNLMEHAAKVPAHEVVHELQKQLSKVYKGFVVPKWMREGSADLLAYESVDNAKFAGAEKASKKEWFKKCTEWYGRDGSLQPEEVNIPDQAAWQKLVSKRRGPYELSGLMVSRLQEKTGDKFYRGLTNYFRLASQKGQKEEAAFEQSFGMTREVFFADFKEWAKKL